MINLLDFAKLSLYIYKDIKTNNQYLSYFMKSKHPINHDEFSLKNTPKNGFYEIIVDEGIQSHSAQAHPFYASFFVKIHNHKAVAAVIAIRGTYNVDNDSQDAKSWWKSFFDDHAKVQIPKEYLGRALIFYGRVKRFLDKSMPLPMSKLFVTGHSLGGALAALMPAYHGIPIRAVTFNAPGIKDINNVHDTVSRILNFRATYDFVSAIDHPIGPRFDIFVPEHAKEASMVFAIAKEHEKSGLSRLNVINDLVETNAFFASFLPQHKMLNLLNSLETDKDAKKMALMSYQQIEMSLANLTPKPAGSDHTPDLLVSKTTSTATMV